MVVAEKPSVARDIARVLGCRQKGQGFLSSDTHTVTWALGHLVTLCEPDEIDPQYKRWKREDLPILPQAIPTKIIPKTKSQYQVVKKLLCDKDTTSVICATDAGREGELIFRLIYEKSGCKKPFDRLWISSMTDSAIKEGLDTLRPGTEYDGLYQSALSRAQADWLVGMNASRAFTLRYGALLSVGRVQTPTLAILVKRAQDIRAFEPETFYTVTADFGDYKGTWFDSKAEDQKTSHRIPAKETAQNIAKLVRGKRATVIDVNREQKREPPPLMYDLTSLQREANKALGFTATKTLSTAQALYETHKAITYPRTDSKYLPRDMVGRVQTALSNLGTPYQPLVEGIPRKDDGKLPMPARVYDDAKVSDHHAIIPTTQKSDPTRLTPDERALYDMVVRRFIAAFYPAHEYEAVRVVTQSVEHNFRSTGRSVLVNGWKDVLRERTQEEQDTLPSLAIGDTRQVQGAKVKQETTKPPAPHTDASLLSAMEYAGRDIEDEALREQMRGSGLGTPATRAAIIERLLRVGYARRQGKALHATQKGEQLIMAVPEQIASPETTAKWEQALEDIAKGQRDTQRFDEGIRRFTEFLVTYAFTQGSDIAFERDKPARRKSGAPKTKELPGVKCPLCHKGVVENAKAFGCANWQDGCAFTLWKDALSRSGGPQLTTAIVTKLLGTGQVLGSTGTIAITNNRLQFTPKGTDKPAVDVGIAYTKTNRNAKAASTPAHKEE
ncbi:MAG: DNA topoisomerase III [Christensenellales bacterium]